MTAPNYSIALLPRLASTSGSIAVGDVLVSDGAGSFVVSTTANRGTKKSSYVSLGATSAVAGSVVAQSHGDISSTISGLSSGSASLVRVSTAGRLERVTSPSVGDDVVGWAEADGTVHLSFGGSAAPRDVLAGSDGVAYVRASQVNNATNSYVKTYSILGAVQTTDTTQTTLLSYAMSDLTLCAFDVIVTCVKADGVKGGRWKRSVAYRRGGGAPAIVGTLETGTDQETDAGLDVTIDVSSNTVRVRVTGLSSNTLRWGGELRVQEQSA